MDGLHGLFHAHFVAGKEVDVFAEPVGKAYGHKILFPQFPWIHMQAVRDLFHVAFHGKADLGHAVAPHGSGGSGIGVYGVDFCLYGVCLIQL